VHVTFSQEEKKSKTLVSMVWRDITRWWISTSPEQEKAAREEKEALENIAVILASLTSKKTAMVSYSILNFKPFGGSMLDVL
jgi:hypothetical protein